MLSNLEDTSSYLGTVDNWRSLHPGCVVALGHRDQNPTGPPSLPICLDVLVSEWTGAARGMGVPGDHGGGVHSGFEMGFLFPLGHWSCHCLVPGELQ